ncbi:MAG: hypothetical protein IJK01_07295 [Clostridia bacterium]|nr:hypothetical protein [Clostridia bacterium]
MNKKLCVALALIMLLSVAYGCGMVQSKHYVETNKIVLTGVTDTEGNGYLPSQDGQVQKLSGDIYTLKITEDRTHTVSLEKDGTLRVLTGEEKKTVDNDVRSLELLCDNSVLYTKMQNKGKYYSPDDYSYDNYSDNEYSYFIYSFLTGETIEFTDLRSYRTAEESGAVLYNTYNTDTEKYALYRLMPSSSEAELLISSSDGLYPIGISNDGSIYVWAEVTDDSFTVYLFADGEKMKVVTEDETHSAYFYYVDFNKEQNFAVISSYDSSKMAIWTSENGISKAILPNALAVSTPYTDVGILSSYPDVDASAVYVQTDEDKNLVNVYSVSLDGSREKLVGNVTDVLIRNHHMYYITEEGTLYCAHVENGNISDEKKITDDVCDFTVSPDGSAIAYAKSVSSDCVGSIYYFSDQTEKPIRLTSEGYCYAYYMSYSKYWMYGVGARFSNDGKKLFYFTNPDEIEGSGQYSASLQVFDIQSQQSERIGSDIKTTFESEYLNGYPKANGIWYYKFITYDSDNKGVICDLMYWNGESAIKLASDIVR